MVSQHGSNERTVTPPASIAALIADKQPHARRWIPLSLRIFAVTLAILGMGSACGGTFSIYRHVVLRSEVERLGGYLFTSSVGPIWLHDLVRLKFSRKLRWVDGFELSGPNVTDSALARVLGGPPIQYLGLHDTQVTTDGFSCLSRQPRLKGLTILGSNVTDAALAHVGSLDELAALNVSQTRISDAGLAQLRPLTKIESLRLDGTSITDQGIEQLSLMPKLKGLSLRNTQITDAGLEHLRNLSNLSCIEINNTQITDAGLACLCSFPSLTVVFANGTQITDAGLVHVKNARMLRRLTLLDTSVTDARIAELRQELPTLDVRH